MTLKNVRYFPLDFFRRQDGDAVNIPFVPPSEGHGKSGIVEKATSKLFFQCLNPLATHLVNDRLRGLIPLRIRSRGMGEEHSCTANQGEHNQKTVISGYAVNHLV